MGDIWSHNAPLQVSGHTAREDMAKGIETTFVRGRHHLRDVHYEVFECHSSWYLWKWLQFNFEKQEKKNPSIFFLYSESYNIAASSPGPS